MANKQMALDYITNKVGDDETVFVLRAQDKFASELVLEWCRLVEEYSGGLETPKTREARETAHQMWLWPHRKVPD